MAGSKRPGFCPASMILLVKRNAIAKRLETAKS
jgi:hypothetical protein